MGRASKMKASVIEIGPDIREAWVEAPLASWAQFLHEMERGVPHAGRERVNRDMRSLLGGFCRFHGTQAQNEAAAKFKSIYERSQVGGAKAVDPSREPVDGGGINPESVIEIGADARRAYNAIYLALGKQSMLHLERVVIGDSGPTAYARWALRTPSPDGRTVGRAAAGFRRLMDDLVKHFSLSAYGTGAKPAGWSDKSLQVFNVDGKTAVISTRRNMNLKRA